MRKKFKKLDTYLGTIKNLVFSVVFLSLLVSLVAIIVSLIFDMDTLELFKNIEMIFLSLMKILIVLWILIYIYKYSVEKKK